MGFRTDALVDSGATATFVPLEIAQVLGVDIPEKTTDALGAGGPFPTHHTKLDELDVFKGTKMFCGFQNVTITVPAEMNAIPHAILGRDLIFLENDITFRERREHTIFRQPKNQSGRRPL